MSESQDPLQKVSQFFAAYAEMRKFQRLYFKNRMIPDLQEAKKWEKEADRLHAELTTVEKSADAFQDRLL